MLAEKMEAFAKVEEAYVEKVDFIAVKVAEKLGYGDGDVPWFRWTWILLLVYTVLTIGVMIYRPDFVNVIFTLIFSFLFALLLCGCCSIQSC
jgi:hypothetical protein